VPWHRLIEVLEVIVDADKARKATIALDELERFHK
jgi:hypothetical protein